MSELLLGITCPSTSTCYATGSNSLGNGEVLETTDSGSTWSTLTSPTPSPDEISCPSTTSCYIAGNVDGEFSVIYATSDSGLTWSLEVEDPDFNSIACPSTTICYAAGTNGNGFGVIYASFSGWAQQTLPSGPETLAAVSCPSAAICYAVGQASSGAWDVFATTDAGDTWNTLTVPSYIFGGGYPIDIACPSTSTCYVSGAGIRGGGSVGVIVATTNSGASWTEQTVPLVSNSMSAIACPSVTTCFAAGNGTILVTDNSGTTWNEQTVVETHDVNSISCPSTSTCFASAESAFLTTTNAGDTWNEQRLPSGVSSYSNMTCPSVTDCFAIAQYSSGPLAIVSTTNSGSTWTSATLPSGTYLSDLACPSVTTCFATGNTNSNAPEIFTSTDSGSTWNTEAVPSATGGLRSLACSSTTTCFAVGNGTGSVGALILDTSSLSITPGSLPVGAVSSAYSAVLAAGKGTAPYTWSIGEGALPAGLSLNASTGAIAGTPTTTGSSSFTVTATDSSSPSLTSSLNLAINIESALAITTNSIPGGTVGQDYAAIVAADGGTAPYTWSVGSGSLPSGLTLDSSTGVINGTPTVAGSSTFTITATDSAGFAAGSVFTIAVTPPLTVSTTSLPSGTQGAFYSATIAVSGGTAPYTWSIGPGSLPSGLILARSTGIITGTPITAGSSTFTITATDSVGLTAETTLTIPIAPALTVTTTSLPSGTEGLPYSATIAASGGFEPYTWSVTAGSLPDGLTLDALTGIVSGTPTVAGTFLFTATVTASDGAGSMSQSFSLVVNQPFAITSPNATTFTEGAAGIFSVTTNGEHLPSFSESGSLPSGVTFVDNGDGTASISGTPALGSVGSYPVTIVATSDLGASAQSFTLVVDQAFAITSPNTAAFSEGTGGSFTVTTNGSPAPSFSESGALPSGVTFTDNGGGTASFSGVADQGSAGIYPVTIIATNDLGASTQPFTLVVDGPPVITGSTGGGGEGSGGGDGDGGGGSGGGGSTTLMLTAGVFGCVSLGGSGWPLPSFTDSGPLPSGVMFNDNGDGTASFCGTPAQGSGGSYLIAIAATNGSGSTTESFTLVVDEAPTISSSSGGTGGSSGSSSLSLTEGSSDCVSVGVAGWPTPSITESGALPPGVTFAATSGDTGCGGTGGGGGGGSAASWDPWAWIGWQLRNHYVRNQWIRHHDAKCHPGGRPSARNHVPGLGYVR